MDNDFSSRPKIILIIFIAQVLLDWLYSLWIESQPGMAMLAWFYVLPLLFFFYFALAVISSIGMYYRVTLGLMLGICILLFGSTTAVISYLFIYRNHPLIEMMIVPLIILNICTILIMVCNKPYFTKK